VAELLTRATRGAFHTLHDALALRATGDARPALIYVATGRAPEAVTRREFRAQARAHAAALRRLGVAPRDLVLIAHTQSLESIYAFWGALLAGAIPAMFPTLTEKLDGKIYRRSMAELATRSAARAILTTDAFAPELAPHVPCPVYASAHIADGLDGAFDAGAPPDSAEIAFLQHSSGTTGLQKGVALAHAAALNQIASYSEAIALRDDDVVVSWLPLYHDMGLIAGFLLPLVQGVPLVLMSPFDWAQHPALLFQAIHEQHGTLCWLPNFAYHHCARRIRAGDVAGLSLASLRLLVNCSEPVHHASHALFLERFAALGVTPEKLGVSYAMAENTFAVTQTAPGVPARLDVVGRAALEQAREARPVAPPSGTWRPDDPQVSVCVSCGSPIAGTAVRVLGEDGRALPERRVGQVAIRSDYMLSGYYKRPDLQPFRDGWYLTGDMGYLADGELYVVGRLKDLIIHAGKNIYPQDVEAIVDGVAGVHAGRAVAFGVPDEREGTELVAVVAEVATEDPAERKHIAAAIRQAVSREALLPVQYVTLVDARWLIKTSSGKLARGANREKWLAERSAGC
jgi:fatty-acyl-CoA synthase